MVSANRDIVTLCVDIYAAVRLVAEGRIRAHYTAPSVQWELKPLDARETGSARSASCNK